MSLFNLYAEYIMKMLDWMKHQLESRLPGEISKTSAMQMTPPLWQKEKKNYLRLLMKVKEKSEKVGLKFNLKKLISWHPIPLLHGKLMGKQLKRVTDLFPWAPESPQVVTAAMRLIEACSLEGTL